MRWTDGEIAILKEHYNESYERLQQLLPGRSKRAIKHKVYQLDLQRDQRRKWSEEEYEILEKHPHYTPKDFVEQGLLDRSEEQVAHRLREVHGTARKQLKPGWDAPSDDLAYLLGAICSDGYIGEYALEFNQKRSDSEFLDRCQEIIEQLLGLNVSRSLYRKSSQNGTEDVYSYLGAYSVELLRALGDTDAQSIGNFRGSDKEWVRSLMKFDWVNNDPYFWAFVSGYYDGDGCTKPNSVSIAVFADESAKWLIDQLERRGFDVSYIDQSIYIKGGVKERRRFFGNMSRLVLKRKHVDWVGIQQGAQRISRNMAENYLNEEHYLSGVPVGTYVGFFEEGVLSAVAVFGSAQMQTTFGDVEVRELRRFASTSQRESSSILSTLVSWYKHQNGDVDVIVTYADPQQGHDGTLYKAMSWEYFGKSEDTIAFYTPDGERISGRYAAKMLKSRNLEASDCDVRIESGKHKYAYICATNVSRRKRIRDRIENVPYA